MLELILVDAPSSSDENLVDVLDEEVQRDSGG